MSFRPTLAALSKKSSTQWMVHQHHDHYVKQRASSACKSRSAFRLLERDILLNFLDHDDVDVIFDLGAAPGGRSQVVSQRLGYGSEEDNELLPSTLPLVRSKRRPAESSCLGSDYDPLNIDKMEEIARSESKGRGTIVAVDPFLVYAPQKDYLDLKWMQESRTSYTWAQTAEDGESLGGCRALGRVWPRISLGMLCMTLRNDIGFVWRCKHLRRVMCELRRRLVDRTAACWCT